MRRKRPLRAECLERRLLLAADVDPLPDFDAQSELVSAVSYLTQDAGSTPGSAADIGSIEGTRSFRGSLGFFDPADTLAFTLDRTADLKIDLAGMWVDADLYLSDRSGQIIDSSARPGRFAESIEVEVEAGDYFITVLAASHWSNRYRLTITANLEAPLPVPSPTLPSSSRPNVGEHGDSNPVSDGPGQSMPEPLADVAYYGGVNEWNLNHIAAPESWAAGYRGQGVTIAVIDTGVDLDHPDLVQSLYVNPGEIPGNGIDDDANGYIDDISGYDFVDNDANPDDYSGHGTHVAGTVAATKNGFGATGVAPDAKVLPVRVLGADGSGSSMDVAAGIRYAADMGAQIINLSLGGSYSGAIDAAIRYAQGVGSLVVAAAGNEAASTPGFPARFSSAYENVISVGAFDSSRNFANFSNRVGASGAIQIDAPGVGIYSTYLGGRFANLSGTSMAAPHVAGLAALMLSAQPTLTAPQLRNLLTQGVTNSARGSDGIGIVNAATSVAYAAAGFTSVASQAGSGTATSIGYPTRFASRHFYSVASVTPVGSETLDVVGMKKAELTANSPAEVKQQLAKLTAMPSEGHNAGDDNSQLYTPITMGDEPDASATDEVFRFWEAEGVSAALAELA